MIKKLVTTFFILLVVSNGFSQNPWTEVAENTITRPGTKREIIPEKYKVYTLDVPALKNVLNSAPQEFTTASRTGTVNILHIPMPDGSIQRFRISHSPIMEPGLQQQFPEIKTYAGQGIDDPAATIRMDWTPYYGFHGMIISPHGDVYIDPYAWQDKTNYISYYRRDFKSTDPYHEYPLVIEPGQLLQNTERTTVAAPCRGTQLWTYRLAVSNTDEYAAAATGIALPSFPTKAQVLAKIVISVNRVTGVYENELSVRMILVANNINIVYNNDPGSPDPYTGNANGVTLLAESQTNITFIIGNPNYDIGHTFSTGAGGIAGLGVVCRSGQKARGVTGLTNPVGDPYDIDYVAHEMGHQFGGNHTFNAAFPSCAANANPGPAAIGGTAYEVGSGTTIQGYAGICFTDDIQPHSDPHFHTVSYDEIINYLSTQACQVTVATGNTIPVITAMNNNNITIPLNTPFVLTGSATDADGDALTYCWEQWDEGLATAPWNSGAVVATDPQFRSRLPKLSGSRTFPDIRVVVANYPPNPPDAMDGLKGETLSTVPRQMRFRLTVRDNRANGGGIITGGNGCSGTFSGTYTVNVDAAGPFLVTAPNGGETWVGGSTQTVTWNNLGTNIAPINCALVNIKLSTDGGLTYPITVLANTPNDGTQTVVVPNINPTNTTVRLRVEAADNIFFDISNADFTVQYNVVLPLTMSSFTVRPVRQNDAELNWKTLLEQNNSGFDIQRSIGDNNSFVSIGFVQSQGNTTAGNEYRFTDNGLPYNTTVYYRLKQIDLDGRSSFSEIRSVKFNRKGIYLRMQPNPVKDVLTIVNDGATVSNAEISIVAMDGRVAYKQKTTLTASINIPVSSLPNGVYTVRIITDEVLFSEKLVKQ